MDFASLLRNPNGCGATSVLECEPTVEAFANVEKTGVSSLEGIDFEELLRSKAHSIHGLNLDREEIVSRLEDAALVKHVTHARDSYMRDMSVKEKQDFDELLKTARRRFDATRRYAGTYNTLLGEFGDNYLAIQDIVLASRSTYSTSVNVSKMFIDTYASAAIQKSANACDREDISIDELRKITSMTYRILERAMEVVDAKNVVRQGARNLCQEYEQCIDPILDNFEPTTSHLN
jgi:hypothetical protein